MLIIWLLDGIILSFVLRFNIMGDERGFGDYMKYSAFAIQMGVTVFLGAYLGKYLDGRFPAEKKWFTMLFTILAVGIALYNLLRQLKKDEEKRKSDEN